MWAACGGRPGGEERVREHRNGDSARRPLRMQALHTNMKAKDSSDPVVSVTFLVKQSPPASPPPPAPDQKASPWGRWHGSSEECTKVSIFPPWAADPLQNASHASNASVENDTWGWFLSTMWLAPHKLRQVIPIVSSPCGRTARPSDRAHRRCTGVQDTRGTCLRRGWQRSGNENGLSSLAPHRESGDDVVARSSGRSGLVCARLTRLVTGIAVCEHTGQHGGDVAIVVEGIPGQRT